MKQTTKRRLQALEKDTRAARADGVRCVQNVYWPEDEGKPENPRYTCYDADGHELDIPQREAAAIWKAQPDDGIVISWGDEHETDD